MPGRRKQFGRGGGPVRAVDEDAVARRFIAARLTYAECARQFRISPGRVKRIMDARGIDPARPVLDKDAVVRAYAAFGSVRSAASASGTSVRKTREVLTERNITLNEGSRPDIPALYRRRACSGGD